MSYTPTTWAAGDTVTAAKLNKLEQGVASGGGVLVVHDVEGTLDKTWQEIHDAMLSGGAVILTVDGQDAYCYTVFSVTKAPDESSRDVVAGCVVRPSNAEAVLYSASSASGYPVYAGE